MPTPGNASILRLVEFEVSVLRSQRPGPTDRSLHPFKRFMEIVELTDEELAAVQEDHDKLEAAVERTQLLSAPTLLQRWAKGEKVEEFHSRF